MKNSQSEHYHLMFFIQAKTSQHCYLYLTEELTSSESTIYFSKGQEIHYTAKTSSELKLIFETKCTQINPGKLTKTN